jgi:hypothetical protein
MHYQRYSSAHHPVPKENKMKIRLGRSVIAVSALLIVLMLAVTPSFADTVLYDNGPINGTVNAYAISGGWRVSDSFTLSNPSTIGSFSAGLWVLSGDSPVGLSWAILSPSTDGLSGSVLASGAASLTAGNLSINPAGVAFGSYSIFSSTVSGMSVSLSAGTYYLELYNASAAEYPNVYWDVNDGHSTAFHNGGTGAIGSEAFTIYGPTSVTPEPGTMLMFGTGALGLLGAIRRRFSL